MGTSRYGRATAELDLFTDAYRITGRALVGAGGIQAELESTTSSYLEMEDVYISRINQPGEIVASYPTAVFRKENINFIMVQDKRPNSGVGGGQYGRPMFTRGRPITVFLTVPSFEIRGELQQEGKVVLRELLAKSLGQFQLLQAAQASASLYPDIAYTSDLIFVHKERIGIFCLAS